VHPVRSCGTCRHFEPSSVLGEGWCRNPRLFGPQHSHRVQQDELDCSHGLGDHWEPALAANAGGAEASSLRRAETGDDAVSAGPRDPFSSEDMARPPRGAAAPRSGRAPDAGRPAAAPPAERYWTDYLRVALPVLGLLLLIGLLWYWASAIIGNGTAEAPKTPVVIANVTPIEPATPAPPVETPPPAIQPTPGLPAPTVPPAIIPPTQAAAAQPTPPPAEPTQPPAPEPGVNTDNPCSGLPVYQVGATVSTTEEVNLRDQPSTEGQRLRVLPQGTLLTVTGDFVESGQCDWWPVTVNDSGEAGFVIEQYLRQEAG